MIYSQIFIRLLNKFFYFIVVWILFFHSCLLSQSNFEKDILDSKKFGTEIGSFINIGSDQFEIDGYLEFKTHFGIFADLWFDQLDLDSDTDIQRYSSIGYMKDFSDDFILGFGYANSKSQSDVSIHEFFGGTTLNNLTSVAYFDIENQTFSFLGSFDISYLIDYKKIDMSLDGLFYNGNKDLFFRLSKTFKSGFTFGNVISKERYEDREKKSIIKNGTLYEYYDLTEKKGYFYLVYIGYIFN